MIASTTSNPFDLERMKRLFGTPVLIGDETMRDFDEFARDMAASLEPGDAAAHSLTYQYILESHWYMRLLRFRGHSNRYRKMSIAHSKACANEAKTSPAEARALLVFEEAFDKASKIDFLINQASKRLSSLLLQLAMYRTALAEHLRKAHEREERDLDIKLKKIQLKKEEDLQALIAQKEEARRQTMLEKRNETLRE